MFNTIKRVSFYEYIFGYVLTIIMNNNEKSVKFLLRKIQDL